MNLRPYQEDLVNSVRECWKHGLKSPCITLPCGGGKSVIIAEIARRTAGNNRQVLFLVHRQELCQQIDKTFRKMGVNMEFCEIYMVQTASRYLNRIRDPTLIITDECHHSLATTYRRIYNHFPNAFRLGVTATPARLDGSGLGAVYDKLIIGPSAKWLIDSKFLSPYEYYGPSIVDLTGIKTVHGDYNAQDIEDKMLKKGVFGDVISSYRKLANGIKTICYCATVKHSQFMSEQFREAGISAVHIDGSTPSDTRDRIINKFRTGEISMLCNVDLISEGFDVPDCGAVIMLRPTKSLTLYIQQAMRCMRYRAGKTAVIIDHVGNYARHGMPDDDREWSLEGKKKTKGKKEDVEGIPLRTCPKCFAVMPSACKTCRECGYEFEEQESEIKEYNAQIERIEGFTINYSTWRDCTSMQELQEYAKSHGYKSGWAYYKAKELNILQ